MSRPTVKPLVWEDFEGMGGARAITFYDAKYMITLWRGRGQFEVAMSYPGYQTGFDGERFHDTLEAAKAAAQADYEARILAALEPAPDHSDWNAAIEVAVKVAQGRSTDGLSDDHPYNQGWRRCAAIISDAIRALKKGPRHD